VALLAGQGAVLAHQGEAGQFMIEDDARAPAVAGMAGSAGLAQIALVHIVLGMTADTLQRGLGLPRRWHMALRAEQLAMRALQGETRHAVMVETGLLPVAAIVAAGAIHAVRALMAVIGSMTAKAGDGRLDELGRLLVARGTGSLVMRPVEREARHLVMIETRLLPVSGCMAAGAIGAILALVGIVLAVAGDTILGRFADCIIRPVASRACGRAMLADQRESGVAIMVEGRGPP